MGNCQAADAAAVVIQHPAEGKVERLYWPATAADVMRKNPGHYVALVVVHVSGGAGETDPAVAGGGAAAAARITKVKLLKPRDTLLIGQVYRLITSQEVTKAVQARRQEKKQSCDELIEQQRPPPPQPRKNRGSPPISRNGSGWRKTGTGASPAAAAEAGTGGRHCRASRSCRAD